jgi:hypothetical protein
LLIPAAISGSSFYNSYFREFKEFHDHRYKSNKGEQIIWCEFIFFLYLYIVLIISYMRVYFTDAGHVPDDNLWNINIPDNISSEMQLELFAVNLSRREEILHANKNIICEENLNETVSTNSKQLIIY